MKFLAFHNQCVADCPSDDQDDHFVSFDIIQGPQVACPKLELRERIGAQALDRLRGCRGLMFQPAQDSRFQDSLLAGWQGPQLPVGVLRNGDLERHANSALLMLGVLSHQLIGPNLGTHC
jgi:hypothetical protein